MSMESIISQIYEKINTVIGGGEDQLFCMQFPAQPLNKNMYTYDTSDRNSIITKPYSVSEAEFRLSDQMFSLFPITAGSNGEKLSINYSTLLNNLIPKLDYLVPFMKDRASLGRWLLEASGEKNPEGTNLSRIELCKKLYMEYLDAKNKWNEEKERQFQIFKKAQNLDGYAKWQSSTGAVELEKLNNLYNDVVVTGHLHEVLTILGYLNASSVSEELELAKQRMRNSSRLSLDESMTVYPVQFSPNNWFKALTPNINPKDLFMATDSIKNIYLDKQKELTRAKNELIKLQSITSSDSQIKALEEKINKAKIDIDKNEQQLLSTHGDNIFNLGKLALKVYSQSTFTAVQLVALGGDETTFDEVKKVFDGLKKTNDLQSDLTRSISSLSNLQAKKIQLESSDYKFNILSLKNRIEELELDVKYYSDLMAETLILKQNSPEDKEISKDLKITIINKEPVSFTCKSNDPLLVIKYKIGNEENTTTKKRLSDHLADQLIIKEKDKEGEFKLTKTEHKIVKVTEYSSNEISGYSALVEELSPEEAELQGLFSDILIHVSSSENKDTQKNEVDNHVSSSSLNTWFTSSKSKNSTSSSISSSSSSLYEQEMEIGFRVAKVSFDRGGWFNPQFFKMSEAFTKLADIKISNQISKFQILKGENLDNTEQCLLPAFPIAMIIAKDITIKIKKSSDTSDNINSEFEAERSRSGSCFCFSSASSSSSKNSSKLTMHGSDKQYFYIKIPGPQILGYYLQIVPEDKFANYNKDPNSAVSDDVLSALKAFNIESLSSVISE
ncbi:hypothetical protein G9F32_16265 [Acinetobacter sp. 194]|uniref:hypothetical protein n=1 Tax=Acinetobacter shaoyimingii TaxID=2715164 RepID=UPI00140D07FF|nr:hypothetical protein [Acinetobacter shaoyimingii]NHB59551.1 hypothetical protein [Acinetobacter shaoyimingii]